MVPVPKRTILTRLMDSVFYGQRLRSLTTDDRELGMGKSGVTERRIERAINDDEPRRHNERRQAPHPNWDEAPPYQVQKPVIVAKEPKIDAPVPAKPSPRGPSRMRFLIYGSTIIALVVIVYTTMSWLFIGQVGLPW